jgi:hypothetical protein
MSLRIRTIAACAAAAAALTVALPASAQTWLRNSDWRQRDRTSLALGPHSIWSFTLELRFGAYYPNIDEVFAADSAYGCGGPYHCYFGNGAQFYFGVELDWLPVRIPYVGKIGPGVGWGFVSFGAKAHSLGSKDWSPEWRDTAANVSDEKTGMTLMPMHVSGVLRIDEIQRRTVIPIVPYVKGGFGFGTWNSGTSQGTSKVVAADGTKTSAEGFSFGPHFALGGMLGLNWLDRRSGAMARESSGVDQAYVFGEWMLTDLKYTAGGKTPLHIGTSSWVIGMALDL